MPFTNGGWSQARRSSPPRSIVPEADRAQPPVSTFSFARHAPGKNPKNPFLLNLLSPLHKGLPLLIIFLLILRKIPSPRIFTSSIGPNGVKIVLCGLPFLVFSFFSALIGPSTHLKNSSLAYNLSLLFAI